MATTHLLKPLAIFATACCVATCAVAQIVVGQTADFSGPAAASVKELSEGALLYRDEVNARGGVHGQRIRLVQLDDRNDPKLTPGNARKLIVDHKALVLFLSRGTPQTQAIIPLLAQHQIALVAPSTGAMVLRTPVHPYIFNVRAPYQREAEQAVHHLHTLGLQRIAVLHVDDSFGDDAAAGAMKGFNALGQQPVGMEKFDRITLDFASAMPKIVAARAQAVLVIGSGVAVARATQLLRQTGSQAQVVTLSNNASSGFVQLLGPLARGMIVTQVFPSERSLKVRVAKEAHDLVRRRGGPELSPAMMEGFVSAKVLVEGLRRAGPNPTRQKIADAFNAMHFYDVGGLEIRFTPENHSGIHYVDLSIIAHNGKFLR
jgi:branched-chain amino acid transport system substrate-binding protein